MVARSKVAILGTLWLGILAVMATEEQTRIVQLEADNGTMARRLVALEQAFAQAQPVPGRPPSQPATDRSSVVDTRLMQKPQSFSGDRVTWSDWAFTFRAYVGAVNGRMKQLLDEPSPATYPWTGH